MSYRHLLGLPLRHKMAEIEGLLAELQTLMKLSGERAMTGNFKLGTHKIVNVGGLEGGKPTVYIDTRDGLITDEMIFRSYAGAMLGMVEVIKLKAGYCNLFNTGDITFAGGKKCDVSAGKFYPRIVYSDSEPTPDPNELLMWFDTGNWKCYLMYFAEEAWQSFKVELT